jgi:hypothetical protein
MTKGRLVHHRGQGFEPRELTCMSGAGAETDVRKHEAASPGIRTCNEGVAFLAGWLTAPSASELRCCRCSSRPHWVNEEIACLNYPTPERQGSRVLVEFYPRKAGDCMLGPSSPDLQGHRPRAIPKSPRKNVNLKQTSRGKFQHTSLRVLDFPRHIKGIYGRCSLLLLNG